MFKIFRWVPTLVIGSLVFSAGAHADWEANFTASSSKKDFPRTTGKFFSKNDHFRVDTTAPFDMSIYAKAGSKQVNAAVHSFHIRLSSNLEKVSGQIPACLSQAFDDCVKRFSLKKSREEKCPDGGTDRLCEVYIGTGGMKDVKRIELWHWKGEKEPILAKSLITKKDGSEIRTDFSKITRKTHDASFFEVPAGYQNAGTLEKFFGDFKGQSG